MKIKVGDACKKCGGIVGQNIDGKPICQCEVWPGNTIDWKKECVDKLGDTTNAKLRKG